MENKNYIIEQDGKAVVNILTIVTIIIEKEIFSDDEAKQLITDFQDEAKIEENGYIYVFYQGHSKHKFTIKNGVPELVVKV